MMVLIPFTGENSFICVLFLYCLTQWLLSNHNTISAIFIKHEHFVFFYFILSALSNRIEAPCLAGQISTNILCQLDSHSEFVRVAPPPAFLWWKQGHSWNTLLGNQWASIEQNADFYTYYTFSLQILGCVNLGLCKPLWVSSWEKNRIQIK